MFDAIKQVFNHRDVTIEYPVGGVPPLPPNYRGRPVLDTQKCMCCAACANHCPPNAIQMRLDIPNGQEWWSINYARCIFCGRCQEVCPTTAIVLTDEIELAVLDKDDLEVKVSFPLQSCSNCGKYFATMKEVDYVTRVLEQGGGEFTEAGAKYITSRCPECKTKVDALRASAREHTTGEPAAYTAEQALRDVYGAPVLNEWAAETELGDVKEADDDLVVAELVKRGIISEDELSAVRADVHADIHQGVKA